MLSIVTNKKEITQCRENFRNLYLKSNPQHFKMILGFQGGNSEEVIYWSNYHKIWGSFCNMGSKFWNPFGIHDPKKGSQSSIIVEINFPNKGINRNVSAAFAKDQRENYYLIHRGKIGGGRKGIGKSLFMDNYTGDIVTVKDGERETEVALIGDLKSPRFLTHIAHFVHEVARIKKCNKSAEFVFNSKLRKKFNSEFLGKKQYTSKANITAECDHGIIVEKLKDIFKSRNYKVANDRNRDLYIYSSETILKVFEIKTSSNTTDVFTGVGQLLLNNVLIRPKPAYYLVLPSPKNQKLDRLLKPLKINMVYYSWKNNVPIFHNLE